MAQDREPGCQVKAMPENEGSWQVQEEALPEVIGNLQGAGLSVGSWAWGKWGPYPPQTSVYLDSSQPLVGGRGERKLSSFRR